MVSVSTQGLFCEFFRGPFSDSQGNWLAWLDGQLWIVWEEEHKDSAGGFSVRGWAFRGGAAPHTHQAFVLQDDLVADPEAQACPGYFLGGEEGFKDARENRGLHPNSGIGNCKANSGLAGVLPFSRAARADDQTAAGCGCVNGIA